MSRSVRNRQLVAKLISWHGTITLNGTGSRDFLPLFFCSKYSFWAPRKQAKMV